MKTSSRPRGFAAVLAIATFAFVAVALVAPPAHAASTAPPTKRVTAKELRRAVGTSITHIARSAKPMAFPTAQDRAFQQRRPDGPRLAVRGATARDSGFVDASRSLTAFSPGANGLWPYGYAFNPNTQIGKLFYDVMPGIGRQWNSCTATAINSENKSVVLTAGHCVFNPDPDQNGIVENNRFWYEDVQFCPGYENGCKLGVWYARTISTTNSWFYGIGGQYDWRDDVAVVIVHANPSKGYLVTAVGGQGITFNQPIGLYRHSFGYPGADNRFPPFQTTYNGEDLVYCPGYDQDFDDRMRIACTMTGGASGGPWIINPASNWLGLVNSVNSHKPREWSPPNGSYSMGGPYFGQAEMDLFQYTRSR